MKIIKIFVGLVLSISLILILNSFSGGLKTKENVKFVTDKFYTLNYPIDKVEKAVEKVFSIEYSVNNRLPLQFRSSYGDFTEEILVKNNNLTKYVLEPSSSWYSNDYLFEGKPALIYGKYKITLEKNKDNLGSTNITIEAEKLQAAAGSYFMASFFASHGGTRMADIQSSGDVEEIFFNRISNYLLKKIN